MTRVQQIAEQLQLQAHPEGGFYTETYRSEKAVNTPRGERPASTAIYFLLTAGNFSAFHRIYSDELWHHYEGDAVHIHILYENGEYQCIPLGKHAVKGEVQQAMVEAGAWFASESVGPAGYSLVGCTVAPGFDFHDFEMAQRDSLTKAYPPHVAIIEKLTRPI